MALLHFKLEGNYSQTQELPNPQMFHSLFSQFEYPTDTTFRYLAIDSIYMEHGSEEWVLDIKQIHTTFGPTKQYCLENLQLRQTNYEEKTYYFLLIVMLNGNFCAIEFICKNRCSHDNILGYTSF